MGLLYRQKHTPLEQLRLTTLVPFIKLKFKLSECISENGFPDPNRLIVQRAMAQELAKEGAESTVKLVEEYCSNTCQSAASVVRQFTSVINCAKFLYRDETDEFLLKGGFKDIPIIVKLVSTRTIYERKTRKPQGQTVTVIPREKKMIPWLKVLEVLEKLRVEANLDKLNYIRRTKVRANGRYGIEERKRTDIGIAQSFQRFLLLALITAMPPGRPRVYRELEIGRTLLRGHYESGIFTPVERMKDPKQEKFYLHLMPEDYKTGDTYGEWWGEFPNIVYSDSKTLYEYIDEWLTKWRKVFNPKHNFVFTQQDGSPLSNDGLKGKVKHIFTRFTGVPVNPHSIRHIYVTYLKDIGATEAELEAAAYAMRHSRKTQSGIYDAQEKQNKLAPILSLTKRIAEEHFQKIVKPDRV